MGDLFKDVSGYVFVCAYSVILVVFSERIGWFMERFGGVGMMGRLGDGEGKRI